MILFISLSEASALPRMMMSSFSGTTISNHPDGSTLNSDCSINSFIMIVSENIFLTVLLLIFDQQEFCKEQRKASFDENVAKRQSEPTSEENNLLMACQLMYE